ncbi:YegP family protein [Lysobacter fragariae]
MKFEIYPSDTALVSQVWRWRLVASNGRTIADSAEGYFSKADCKHGIDLVKGANAMTPVEEVRGT